MFPTHLLFGIFIVVIYGSIFDVTSQSMLILTSIIGSVVSDLDLFIGQQRKTLHYPVYGLFLFIITIPLIFALPTISVYINCFILCFGTHSVLDAVGG